MKSVDSINPYRIKDLNICNCLPTILNIFLQLQSKIVTNYNLSETYRKRDLNSSLGKWGGLHGFCSKGLWC